MKLLATIPVLVLLAAGCIEVPASPQPGAECPATPTPSPPSDGRFEGQTLRILDHGAFPAFSTLEPIFEEQTGADLVQITGGDAGKALQQALLGAGNPPADILYGVDNALFFTRGVQAQCLYLPYTSPNIARVQSHIDAEQFKVGGDLWTTPVDYAYIGVNYDIRLEGKSPTPPTQLRDLASPAWAPRFVTSDPRESSPGLGFLLASIDTFGETGDYSWKAFWRELLENGALVVDDWTTAYVYHYSGGYGAADPENKGDRSIVVSYTTSPAVEVYFGADAPPGVSLEPPRGVMPQVETMGILRGTKVPDLARAWIDFCLTNHFQSITAPQLATYPVVDGIDLPEAFDQHATPPQDLRPAELGPDAIRTNLDRWLDEWEDLYHEAQS